MKILEYKGEDYILISDVQKELKRLNISVEIKAKG